MHKPEKGEVPAFVFEKPGKCYEFITEEFEYLISSSAGARPVPAESVPSVAAADQSSPTPDSGAEKQASAEEEGKAEA
ncbi:MAG: hypothetical protein K8I27_05685 [Planctomycetes bacterium]|nr:hypothetical protein [Planctomycetota bacterium]